MFYIHYFQKPKITKPVKTRNRKTKSLAVISRRFLERLPLYPSAGDPVILSLNHLPTELGVERRRIYDILNILESVEMVRRLGMLYLLFFFIYVFVIYFRTKSVSVFGLC